MVHPAILQCIITDAYVARQHSRLQPRRPLLSPHSQLRPGPELIQPAHPPRSPTPLTQRNSLTPKDRPILALARTIPQRQAVTTPPSTSVRPHQTANAACEVTPSINDAATRSSDQLGLLVHTPRFPTSPLCLSSCSSSFARHSATNGTHALRTALRLCGATARHCTAPSHPPPHLHTSLTLGPYHKRRWNSKPAARGVWPLGCGVVQGRRHYVPSPHYHSVPDAFLSQVLGSRQF